MGRTAVDDWRPCRKALLSALVYDEGASNVYSLSKVCALVRRELCKPRPGSAGRANYPPAGQRPSGVAAHAHRVAQVGTVTRVVDGRPGPSIIDLPKPGCWHLALQWGDNSDTLNLPAWLPDLRSDEQGRVVRRVTRHPHGMSHHSSSTSSCQAYYRPSEWRDGGTAPDRSRSRSEHALQDVGAGPVGGERGPTGAVRCERRREGVLDRVGGAGERGRNREEPRPSDAK